MITIQPIDDATVIRIRTQIEAGWRSRAKAQGLKHGTATYKDREVEFFVGAMVALQAIHGTERLTPLVPPSWSIAPMTGRCIVDK